MTCVFKLHEVRCELSHCSHSATIKLSEMLHNNLETGKELKNGIFGASMNKPMSQKP